MTDIDKLVIREMYEQQLINFTWDRKRYYIRKPTKLFYQTLCEDLHKLKRKRK